MCLIKGKKEVKVVHLYSAAYTGHSMTSSASQSRKWQLTGTECTGLAKKTALFLRLITFSRIELEMRV